jgi:putative oligomerization/nucleic acid binding protein
VKGERVSWLLYFVGSLLVFASWMDLVPNGLGWIGWLMALVGWAIGSRISPTEHAPLSAAEQLEKLDNLRSRKVITEQEFQQEKQRLLNQLS